MQGGRETDSCHACMSVPFPSRMHACMPVPHHACPAGWLAVLLAASFRDEVDWLNDYHEDVWEQLEPLLCEGGGGEGGSDDAGGGEEFKNWLFQATRPIVLDIQKAFQPPPVSLYQ
eukprot:GHVU01194987.1.p1 GENE.GHVU01194987.1~~GHVU01194987.1.p1  ORF type:complete len:116 (+),score=19.71 GHVU01194987.1:89-436(+)